ncbi:MAG: hypothetical protein ACYSU4_04925 [Planctomycetota bacterium]
MKKLLIPGILIGFFATAVFPKVVVANDLLTPEQLFSLMKASREQYFTFDAEMIATSYKHDINDVKNEKPQMTRKIISRWTKDRSFGKITQTNYTNGASSTKTYTYAIANQWSKRLLEKPNKVPRGVVRPGSLLNGEQAFYTVEQALWSIFGFPLEKANLEETKINYDDENDVYVVKGPVGSQMIAVLYVDPSLDFIPVKKEIYKQDGTLLLTFECDDFHESTEGLWIPRKYMWFDPRKNYSVQYKIENIKVNESIDQTLLNFDFPEGTVVNDEISGLRYMIGGTKLDLDVLDESVYESETDAKELTPALESILEMKDLHTKVPANQKQLEESFSKAEKILSKEPSLNSSNSNKGFIGSYWFLLIVLSVMIPGIGIMCFFVRCKREIVTK